MKLTLPLLILVVTTLFSCKKEEAIVGDVKEGGIVIWSDGNGGGIVCSTSNQSDGIRWDKTSYEYLVTGATGVSIGSGSENTESIINTQYDPISSYAAGLAKSYRGSGYDDWFLPSKGELNLIYMNKELIDSLSREQGGTALITSSSNYPNLYFWSSTEHSDRGAWGQDFSVYKPEDAGEQVKLNKYVKCRVRAVRKF